MHRKKTIAVSVATIVGVLLAIYGVVYGYGRLNEKQNAQDESLGVLKVEGCIKARGNENAIIAIQGDIKNINKSVQRLETAQTAGFKEVMEELRKQDE